LITISRKFANRAKHKRKAATKKEISKELIPHERINTDDYDDYAYDEVGADTDDNVRQAQYFYIKSFLSKKGKNKEAIIEELNRIALSIQEDVKTLDKYDAQTEAAEKRLKKAKPGTKTKEKAKYTAFRSNEDWGFKWRQIHEKEYVYFALKDILEKLIRLERLKENKPLKVSEMPVFNTKLKKQIKDLKALRKKKGIHIRPPQYPRIIKVAKKKQ